MIQKAVLFFLLFTTCWMNNSLAEEVSPSEMCLFLNNKTGYCSYFWWDLCLERQYYDVPLMGDNRETACIEEKYIWDAHNGYSQFYAVKSDCENKMIDLESLKSELKEGFQDWKKNPILADLKAYFEVETDGRTHSPTYKIEIHDRVGNNYRKDSRVLQHTATVASYCVSDHKFPYEVWDENNILIATINVATEIFSNRETYSFILKDKVNNYRPSKLYIYQRDNDRNMISTDDI